MLIPIWPELFICICSLTALCFISIIVVIFYFIYLKEENNENSSFSKIKSLIKKRFYNKIDFSIIAKVVLFFSFIFVIFFLVASFIAPNYLTFLNLSNKSTDTATIINGLMSPFIAIAAAILTFMAFWVQYNANQNIFKENKKQQEERQFYEMLKIHRDNVDKIEFVHFGSEQETLYGKTNQPSHFWKKEFILIHSKGQTAIKYLLAEFKCIYNVVAQKGFSPPKQFEIAYDIYFNGLKCSYKKCKANSVYKNLCEKKIEVNKTETSEIPRSSIMDGHKDILNPYYRHLYLTVRSIVDSNFSTPEKKRFLDTLRASLTAEEQVLLLFNWYYGKIRNGGYGFQWENKEHKYLTQWKMIHNIVEKDFNIIKGLDSFENIKKELETDIKTTDLFQEAN